MSTTTRTSAPPTVHRPELLAAALDAAAHGWAVLPCHPSGERAKSPIGQLVPRGFHDASTDPAVVTAWWSRHPAAMIGAAVPESLLVLDVDPRHGGSLAELQRAIGALPRTLTALSGRGDGGRHLYFHRLAGALSARAVPRGVDVKVGGKGYVILPPSLHPATGMPYRWEAARIAHLPPAAVAALRPLAVRATAFRAGPRAASSTAGLVRTVVRAEPGDRNAALYWAACRAVEGGHGPDVLDEIGAAAISAGLAEREVAATLASARRTVGGAR